MGNLLDLDDVVYDHPKAAEELRELRKSKEMFRTAFHRERKRSEVEGIPQLRERLICAALTGLTTQAQYLPDAVAEDAIGYADAVLRKLEKSCG